MPCIPIAGGFACTGRQRRRRCSVKVDGVKCTNYEERTCDAPNCNKALCLTHAVHVNGKDLDYCPTHPEVIAALERRRA